MSAATGDAGLVGAALVDEWVRCAKRGDTQALALLRPAVDPECGWRPEIRAKALFVLWKQALDGAAKEAARVALESLASAEDALGVTVNKWAITLAGDAQVRALERADAAHDGAEGKAASRLGALARAVGDERSAAQWFWRGTALGCPGAQLDLYRLSLGATDVVSKDEGLACLAAAVAAEDTVALEVQSQLHEAEGDQERAIYYADLAVAARRREGVHSLEMALRAVTLRYGADALHGVLQSPAVPHGSASQHLQDAIFSESHNNPLLVRRGIVLLGRVLAHEGRWISDELKAQIAALASKGYRPAITLAEALGIDFDHVSNVLANHDYRGPHPARAADFALDFFAASRELFAELQRRLERDPAGADAFWNQTIAAADPAVIQRLITDPGLLSLRAQLAHALGRKESRDTLLREWEALTETLPAKRQSEERERCETARVRYNLFDGGQMAKTGEIRTPDHQVRRRRPLMRVAVGGHPAAICACATMLGAMGRSDLGLWVLSFLNAERDAAPAKTSLLRAELEVKAGCAGLDDTLACYTLIDDVNAKPIDRQRACAVFVARATTAEIVRRIPTLISASSVAMLGRDLVISRRSPSMAVMASCAQHYFAHPHAELYAEALVDLMRAQLWASYCFADRREFLNLLECVGEAARRRALAGSLHPDVLSQLLTLRPETWLRMFDATSWKQALDAIELSAARAAQDQVPGVKPVVRDVVLRQMEGADWQWPLSALSDLGGPRLPMRGDEVLGLLRDAARRSFGNSHGIGMCGDAPTAWYFVDAVQRGVRRVQTHLTGLRVLFEDADACEQYSVDLRCSGHAVSLDVSLRLTDKGVRIAQGLFAERERRDPIGPGLLTYSISLIPRGIVEPSQILLHTWITDAGQPAFWEWWKRFESGEARVSGVLRAIAWQCDQTWVLGHRQYGTSAPPARGALHRLKNLLDHRADDETLIPWLHAQLHSLRRELSIESIASRPVSAVADLGAILNEIFRLAPPVPPTLVQIEPDLLRGELFELSNNCRQHSTGAPSVTLMTAGTQVQVEIANKRRETQAGTQFGIELLVDRLQKEGVTVAVQPGETTFSVRLGFSMVPVRAVA